MPQGFTFQCLEKEIDSGAILFRQKELFPDSSILHQIWCELEGKATKFLLSNIHELKTMCSNRYYVDLIEGFART